MFVCRHCPKAHLLVISNPVNATVPIAYETLLRNGVSNPSVFGVTTLDLVRAQTFVAEALQVNDPEKLDIKVIGGHSGITIIPLINKFLTTSKDKAQISDLVHRIQYGGDEVVKAKAGGGSATLSMAYAAYRFYDQFMKALTGFGQGGRQVLTAYVKVPEGKGSELGYKNEYFATECVVGRQGLEQVLPLPKLSPEETQMYEACVQELQKDIAKGKQFAHAD